MHRVSDIDPENKTGTCQVCGPNVPLSWKSRPERRTGGSWGCAESVAQTNAKKWQRKHFGRVITDEKQSLLEAQEYKCAVCPQQLTFETARLDHCHETKKIRGVLCNSCNMGLGYFKDNRESLLAAIEYLA